MKFYGTVSLPESANNLQNLIIPTGTSFPPASDGELFYLTQAYETYEKGLYAYYDSEWVRYGNIDTDLAGRSPLHGTEDITQSTLSYNEITRTVTITPTGTSFNIWSRGVKYEISTTIEWQHSDVTGEYFFYFNASGQPVISQSVWNLYTDIPICFVYYNATISKGVALEERHSAWRDPAIHERMHIIDGTQASPSGFAIADYLLNNNTNNSSINFSISSGDIYDEDLKSASSQLNAGGPYQYLYRSGSAGNWVWTTGNSTPFISGATYVQKNDIIATNWTLTEILNNSFMNFYVMVIPTINYSKIFIVPGQYSYTSQSGAEAESVTSLSWGTMPFAEIAPLYKITVGVKSSYAGTTGNCRILGIERLKGSRSSLLLAQASATHNSLSGRSSVDSHPASSITFTPTGDIQAIDVQSAIAELDTEKSSTSHDHASITGNAATATSAATLTTTRNIALSGDVSGNADFDGSQNITIITTVSDDSHSHSNYVLSTNGTATGLTLTQTKSVQATDQSAGSGTVTLDYANSDYFKVTATGSISIALSNLPVGYVASITLKCVDFGAYTITWPSGIKWSSGAAPAMTSSGVDFISFIKDASETVYGFMLARDSR